jgi:hypothetical protein
MEIPNLDQPSPLRWASSAPSSKPAPADARSPSCFDLGVVVQGPQLDLQVAGAGRLRPRRREQRPGVGRVVVLLDHAQGDQHVGFLVGAAGAAGGRQGLVAPAAGVVAAPGVDQRLGDGGGHPGPQPGGRLGGHQLDRLGAGGQRLLDPAGVEQVQAEALVGAGGPRRVPGGLGGRGRVLGEARRPPMLSGGAGRRGRPQGQLDLVDAGDRGRLGHPLPQRQRRCRWRRASAGARTASASEAARTDAASAPTRSWLARQWWASSAAAPPGSAASRRA